MEECNKIGFLPPTEKTYYRNLKSERRSDCHDTLPDKQSLTAFWASTWGIAVKHNLKASWIRREQTKVSNVTAMEHSPVTTEEVSRLIAKTLNWKALGPYGIKIFWIKRFTATHSYLAHHFNQFMGGCWKHSRFSSSRYHIPTTEKPRLSGSVQI